MQRSIVEEFARGVIRTFELPKGRSRSQYHHDADFTDRKELITTKRMERRSPGGRLISVTDMRTRHFDDTRPRQYSPPPPIREERRSRYDDFYAQREFSSSYYSPDSVSYEERRYSPRKRVEINRPISVERQQRYSDNFDPLTIHDSTSTPYDDWRRTDSVVKQSTIVKNPHLYEENPESPYVTSMNALVARINYLRRSAGRRELLHSPKLARIAGEWAERIARTGQMRLDEEYPMNVWMGPVVTPSIADTWWQESEIYSSSNYFKQVVIFKEQKDDLLHIAAAKTFCDRKSAYVVVAVSADIGWQSAIGSIANTGYGNCQQWTQLPDGRTCCLVNYNGQNQWQCFNNQQQDMGNGQYNNYWQQYCQSYPYIQDGSSLSNGGYANQQYWYIYCSRYPYSPCCPRASKVAPIPYPGAYYYVGVPAVYGEPLSNDDFVDILGSYSSSYPPDNDTMSIDNGLSYVLYNLNQSRNAAGSFLPRVVILVANKFDEPCIHSTTLPE
ncbi:hypothetical protein WR25_03214 [Diploscapter pachys]|uniref:SCP domain-containing protein n=1 Tax=Diploscapter pachys TaxID=2018661 RepID=A0A2A2KZ13_9BILA|nr:hypothetical protein WR25_03214 [Diploscapter pachys]